MRSSDPVKNVQRRSLEHTLPASMTVGSKQHLLRRSISNNKQSVVFKSETAQASTTAVKGPRLAWISEGANKSWCSPTGARPVRVRP